MAKIEHTGFRGLIPRMNPAMLGENVAQVAHNVQLWHGDARPMRAPADLLTPPSIGREIKTIYRMGQSLGETQHWLCWGSDVDVVRGIVSDDPDERTYYTGDGVPKFTTLPLATQGGTQFPVNSYTLGIPRPATAMKIRPPGPSLATPGGNTLPQEFETRVYVYTYVDSFGQEGAPSPPASMRVAIGAPLGIGGMAGAPAGNFNIVSKRIYRSANTGANTGDYFFEAEIPIGWAMADPNDNAVFAQDPSTHLYWLSMAATADLSEPMITLNFDMPPDDLQGIVALPGGVMAGFSGYDLYFSEPGYPYAWPRKYNLTTDWPIVGLGVFGNSLVVCTKGQPYLVNGSHPDSMSMEKVALDQACVSKRSITSFANGVVYASPNGICYVGSGDPRILTEGLYTAEEWKALPYASLKGYSHEGKYVAIHDAGGFMLNSLEDTEHVTFDGRASCGYVDLRTDTLYLCIDNSIKKFNRGAANTLRWRGKKHTANGRPGPKCAKVQADGYPVTFRLFADGALKYELAVPDEKVFRLPAGYRAQELELEIESQSPVLAIGIADAPEEFRNG
jgi:hypothetical protein